MERHIMPLMIAVSSMLGAPPSPTPPEGDEVPSVLTSGPLIKAFVYAALFGWSIAIAMGLGAANMVLNSQNKLSDKLDCIAREHEVVKNNQARLIEELKAIHQEDAEQWKTLHQLDRGR